MVFAICTQNFGAYDSFALAIYIMFKSYYVIVIIANVKETFMHVKFKNIKLNIKHESPARMN